MRKSSGFLETKALNDINNYSKNHLSQDRNVNVPLVVCLFCSLDLDDLGKQSVTENISDFVGYNY